MEITPEKWRYIEDIYNAVTNRPADREALLANIDPEIRRDVELLLHQDESTGRILDHPLTDLLEGLAMRDLVGTKLGPYQIEDVLGKGGMGEVFRARDTRLGREVD